jgi:hypothetical protein
MLTGIENQCSFLHQFYIWTFETFLALIKNGATLLKPHTKSIKINSAFRKISKGAVRNGGQGFQKPIISLYCLYIIADENFQLLQNPI